MEVFLLRKTFFLISSNRSLNNAWLQNLCTGFLENIGSLGCVNLVMTSETSKYHACLSNNQSIQVFSTGKPSSPWWQNNFFPDSKCWQFFSLKRQDHFVHFSRKCHWLFAVESFYEIKMFRETWAAQIACVSFQLLPNRVGQAFLTHCNSVGQSSV